MRERIKKKKNMIIGGLLALIFVMSVGYAAFATNLNISGTANTSSWIIKITNITEKTKSGGAGTVSTSYTDLTATFSSTLTQPGDSITYEVTVENQGNIDASLKEVTKTYTQNKYIEVTYDGLLEGQMLYKQGQAGSTAVMEVTVTFKDIEIEKMDSGITSNITISLDFEQEGNNVDTTKKYLVQFDSDGGTPVESVLVGWDEKNFVKNIPTKLGRDFNGWRTARNGLGELVSSYEKLSDVFDDPTVDEMTIYASWVQKKYHVNYDSQGGSAVASEVKSWTDRIDAYTSRGSKGYTITFKGWYTSPNGGGLKVTNTTTVGETYQYIYGKYEDDTNREINLYADWEVSEKDVTLILSAMNNTPSTSQTLKWTEPITSLPTPTKEGNTFVSWNTLPMCLGNSISVGTSPSQFFANDTSSTLFACWQENQ